MKFHFLSGTAMLAMFAIAGSAHAQSAEPMAAAPAVGDGDIVVTARRHEESLQSIPAAVSAVTQETLTRAGASSLADIAHLTPGLTFNQGNAGGLASPTIRGVSTTTTTTFDNNVGVFLDGVYLSAKSNLNIDLFALSRVEVIKGPQSALYGNNAFSGAIDYVLAKPTDTWTGRVKGTVGTYGRREIAGLISGPITDTLSLLVTGNYSHFDGTVDNTLSKDRLGGWKYKVSGSAMLRWQPTDKIDASLFYYHYQDMEDGSANYIFANNCGGLNSSAAAGGTATARGITTQRYACGTLQAPSAVSVDPASYSKRRSDIAIGKVAYKLADNLTARITGSYGNYNTFAIQDQSLNAVSDSTTTANRKFTQPFVGPVKEYSAEFRLESYGNHVFDWAAGGYYFNRNAVQKSIVGYGLTQTNQTLDSINNEKTSMKSVFGIGTFHITPKLDLELQGRWTWEAKNAILTNALTDVVRTPSKDFSYGTYRATANYTWTDGKLIYGVVAKGTKSGGFNNTAVASEQSYNPETNTTFEIGSKNRFANGLVTINVAAFYVDWSQLQLSVPSAVYGQINPVTNIGGAKVKGAEIEFGLRPTSNWTINLAYTYSDATWNKGTVDYSSSRNCATAADCYTTASGTGVNIGGYQLPRSSSSQGSLSSTYTVPLASSSIYFRGDVSYRSAQYLNSPVDLQSVGDLTLVNGRIGWVKGPLELSIFGTNLFDKRYISDAINEPEFSPSTTFTTGFVAEGRVVGLTADLKL